MNKFLIKAIILSLYACAFIFLWPYFIISEVLPNVYSSRNNANYLNYASLDQFKHCLEEQNILSYLRLRQKLYAFSFDELRQLQKYASKKPSFKELVNLISGVCAKKYNIYVFKEDFFLGNIPVMEPLPFYKGDDYIIEKIARSTERLYFNNLELPYRNNLLKGIDNNLFVNTNFAFKTDDSAAVPSDAGLVLKHIDTQYMFQGIEHKWQYKLKSSNIYNTSHERLIVKKYCENRIQPLILGDTVIFRNAYRLFAIGLDSGKQLWSISPDISGEEFYQTVAPWYTSPYGYEMAFDNGTIYAELAGRLVAYNISSEGNPVLKWKSDLGEYVLTTKPVSLKNILVLGLINGRGELWACGFSKEDGTLKWSTYVGLSGFSSPLCSVSAVSKDKIFLATNHGILICLNSADGQIVWLRKYESNKYSVFEWFSKQQSSYKNREHEGFIEFDSQFIIVNEEENSLAYKPRESDVLYLLNPATGKLIDEIRNDPSKYAIISMNGSMLIMLDIHNENNIQFLIVNYPEGKILYKRKLCNGKLSGIAYKNKEELSFKVGSRIYTVFFSNGSVKLREMNSGEQGWLLECNDTFLFLAGNDTVKCFRIGGDSQDLCLHKSKTEKQEELLLAFDGILDNITQIDGVNKTNGGKNSERLLKQLKASCVPAQKIIPAIISNLNRLKGSRQESFFEELNGLYGDEIVEYKGVSLRFNGFLQALELLKNTLQYESWRNPAKLTLRSELVAPDNLSVLPINVISGNTPDFFILSHNYMVYCVDESGKILWSKKVAFKQQAHGAKDIEVYLCNGVLIINDKINVIAVHSKTGNYIWSVTNDVGLDKNIFLQDLRGIEYKLAFFDNNILLVHGNKINSIDPYTGFCNKETMVPVDNIEGILVFDKRTALFTSKEIPSKKLFLWTVKKHRKYDIYILNNNLETLNKASFGNKIKNFQYFDLCLFDKKIVILLPFGLYTYNTGTGGIKRFLNFSGYHKAYFRMRKSKEDLILIRPFDSILGFKPGINSLLVKWSHQFGTEPVKSILEEDLKTSFAVDDSNAVVFTKNHNNYSLILIRTKDGLVIWESQLGHITGEFADLYNIHLVDNYIYLIMYSALKFSRGIVQEELKKTGKFACNLYPVLMKINRTTGDLEYVKEFTHIVNFGYARGMITHTKNFVLFTINGNKMFSERRNKI